MPDPSTVTPKPAAFLPAPYKAAVTPADPNIAAVTPVGPNPAAVLPIPYRYPAVKDETFHYSPTVRRISRDRFFELHHYLHFVDNATLSPARTPGYDKLGKVQPNLDMLSERFTALLEPQKEISIDEAMIKFEGRSTLKQYMPPKNIKRGIKVWMRADALSGYVSAFEVYTGIKAGSAEKGLGASVVKTLTEDLQDTFRHVYFNNFFSSVDVMPDLYRLGLYSCGTLKANIHEATLLPATMLL